MRSFCQSPGAGSQMAHRNLPSFTLAPRTGPGEALPGSTRALLPGSSGAGKSQQGHGLPYQFLFNTTAKVALARSGSSGGLNVNMDPERQKQREGRKKHRGKNEAKRSLDRKTEKAPKGKKGESEQ